MKNTLKQARRKSAKERLEAQLVSGVKQVKDVKEPLTEKDITRIKNEIKVLSGDGKKPKVDKKGEIIETKERWFIDIYHISFSYIKNSERRKNKGKSRKKTKKVKTRSLVKSVVMQPNLMQAYREGRMGISPKNHSFSARKEEPLYIK